VAKSDLVQMDGIVKEVMVDGHFRVEVEGGHSVLAQLAGNLSRSRIRIVLGDRVTVSVPAYDPTRGLITFRAK
jgi:translation initiation factor IF-1